MTADWQRSQAALLAMGERMGHLHEKNPGASAWRASLDVNVAWRRLQIAQCTYTQDSLLTLAAAALYAWVVVDEERTRDGCAARQCGVEGGGE